MSKLAFGNRIPKDYDQGYFSDWLRKIEQQLNGISETRMVSRYNALTAAPTTGTWALGDEVYNSNPSEAGGAGSKYIVIGWKCTAAGTPGTWLPMRVLTGN